MTFTPAPFNPRSTTVTVSPTVPTSTIIPISSIVARTEALQPTFTTHLLFYPSITNFASYPYTSSTSLTTISTTNFSPMNYPSHKPYHFSSRPNPTIITPPLITSFTQPNNSLPAQNMMSQPSFQTPAVINNQVSSSKY